MWGVAATDLVQFVMAMIGSVALAWYAIREVGGLDALQTKLDGLYGAEAGMQRIVPPADSELLSPMTLLGSITQHAADQL